MANGSPRLPASDAARICEHMNAEHADDLLRFARVFGQMSEATSAQMTGIDAEGLALQVETTDAAVPLRLTFEDPVHGPEEARSTLVDMALSAREAAG